MNPNYSFFPRTCLSTQKPNLGLGLVLAVRLFKSKAIFFWGHCQFCLLCGPNFSCHFLKHGIGLKKKLVETEQQLTLYTSKVEVFKWLFGCSIKLVFCTWQRKGSIQFLKVRNSFIFLDFWLEDFQFFDFCHLIIFHSW